MDSAVQPEKLASVAATPRMPPEQRREQLLDITGDLVLAEGFGAVSIDRVARDAKIARTVVYAQFENIDGLFTALLERTERQALEQVRAVVPDLPIRRDPDEVLVDAILAFATVVVSHPRTWGLALLPVEGAPSALRDRIAAVRAAITKMLQPIVVWGIEARGGPEGIDVELLTMTLVTLGEDGARLTLTDPERFPPARLAAYASALIGALRRS
jgi:AcrR family transcriptional regulator